MRARSGRRDAAVARGDTAQMEPFKPLIQERLAAFPALSQSERRLRAAQLPYRPYPQLTRLETAYSFHGPVSEQSSDAQSEIAFTLSPCV